MLRFLTAVGACAAVVALAFVSLTLPGSIGTANACSIVTPADKYIGESVERSAIVAIGKWEAVSAHEVTFVVEQPLKGTKAGERLAVDNRTTYTAFACSPYDEPFREGYRFVPGERAVVLLEKEVDGLWQVSYLSLAAFEVPESLNAPLEGVGWYFGDPEGGSATDIRLSTIVAASGFEGAVSLAPAALPPRAGATQAPPGQTLVHSESVPGGDGRNWWPFVALGGGATGVAVGAFGLRYMRR
jgi:hypothetical protein